MVDGTSKRRDFLRYAAVASAMGVAGCSSGQNKAKNTDGGGDGSSGGGSSGSGSGGGGESPWVHDQEQVSDPKEVEWLNLGSMDGDPAAKSHAKKWSEQSGVEAVPRVVPPADALSKSRTLLQSKSARPDIYQLADSWWWDLGSKGYFERLDEFITTFDAWVPGAKKACTLPLELPEFSDFTYPKGIYAVPWFSEGWITFSNMDVLEEAGLSRDFTPSSYTEFLDACEKLTDVVETPVLFPFSNSSEGVQVFQDLVLRAGGHFYDGTEPDFTNDGFVNALDFLLTLVSKGYAPEGVTSLSEGQTTTQFFDGKAGFQFNALGNLFLPGKQLPIDKPAKEVARILLYPNPDNLGYEETPTGNLIVVGANLSVFSKRKEPAAKFMNYISSQEAQARELLLEGNLPLRADVFELEKVQKEMPYADMMEAQLAGYDKLIYPNASQVTEILYQEITGAFANDGNAEKTAQRIQKKAENL